MWLMKHLWEVDIGLSESKTKLTPDDLDGVISRSRKGRSILATAGLLVNYVKTTCLLFQREKAEIPSHLAYITYTCNYNTALYWL